MEDTALRPEGHLIQRLSTLGVTRGAFHRARRRPTPDAPLANGWLTVTERPEVPLGSQGGEVPPSGAMLLRSRVGCQGREGCPVGVETCSQVSVRCSETWSHSTPRGTCRGSHRLRWADVEASGACCHHPFRNKQVHTLCSPLPTGGRTRRPTSPRPRSGFSADTCPALALSGSELLLPCGGGCPWFLDPALA